jgi:aldose 1-epimerase
MTIHRAAFGITPEGHSVNLFTITNSLGYSISLIDYGAILVTVKVPDRNGQAANVNLGYSKLDGYLTRHPYFGATVGRFCNRIGGGIFSLDGQVFTLATNHGSCHLHGGICGFDKLMWKATELTDGIQFEMTSPHGQEGYPGNLRVTTVYKWNDNNQLTIQFTAQTDKPTVLNLTNHAYWNLTGAGNGDVLQHRLRLNCDQYLMVDATLIPTGEIALVAGTGLDFRQWHAIGERIALFPATKGYDHCYVINGPPATLRTAGRVEEPQSGRVMEVATTQPAMQLYTGNHLSGEFCQHAGFCLETQHFPDAPNKPQFPTTRLNPGESFSQTTVYGFSTLP